MNNPTEDGLSSDEEYPMLCDIEDEVIDRLESLEDIFAGTVKTQGRLELYVFTKNPEKSEELCKEAFKKFPNYQWKSYIDEDREWDFYFNFLYSVFVEGFYGETIVVKHNRFAFLREVA